MTPASEYSPIRTWAFSFVTVVWFALNLLSTLSSVNPDVAWDSLGFATFPIAFLYPPLLLHLYSGAKECSGPSAARASRRPGWTVSFWALYALGPVMSLAVPLIGYHVVRLPPIGTLDARETYGLFLDAANVLLGVLFTVAMVYSFLGLAKSGQRRESSTAGTAAWV